MILIIIFVDNPMINLDYIIKNSGDSTIEYYQYSGGILTIDMYLIELDKKVRFRISTDTISTNDFYINAKEDLYRTCRIEINELNKVLLTENNIYCPSNSFGKFMNETRSKYHLAFGRKSSEIKYIVSLVGYDRLITCLLSDLDKIIVDPI